MNRNRLKRVLRISTLSLLSLSLLVLPWLLSGCKTGASGARPAKVFTSQDWEGLDISTLAYLGLGASVGDQASREFAADLVEQELRSSQTRFVVLNGKTGRSRAKADGQLDLFEKVDRVWKDVRKVDQFLAKDLCEMLGVDGLILADMTDWSEERIDWHTEGTSWTRVGLGLFIYSGETGLLAWGAEQVKQADSIPYRPSESSSGFSDAGESQRTDLRNERKVPDPPKIDEVARAVIAELIEGFPPASP